jgi:hypothetical protein
MPQVVQALAQLGWPAQAARPLGLLLMVCTLLYAFPKTSMLGVGLMTAKSEA